MSIQQLGGHPIANVPYLTSSLLKLHGRIVTVFSPFKPDENCLWELVKRVGLLFSCLFVYPVLGILTLAGCISSKFSAKSAELRNTASNSLHHLVNEEIESAKGRFSSVILKNNYWWFIEVDLHHVKGLLTDSDFHGGSYRYLRGNIASSHENYMQFLTVEDFWWDTLNSINPNKFEITFKFIIVEKESEENFNLYSYDRIVHSRNNAKKEGGFQSNTSVPKDAARNFLREQFQEECPFEKI